MTDRPKKPDTLAMPAASSLQPHWATQVSAHYEKLFPLRAAIQAIPVVGGSLDTMFAGLGARWQAARVDAFLRELASRLETVEIVPPVHPNEPLYDFVRQVLQHVAHTRSVEKRARFADLVARQVVAPQPWDDADAAERIVAELSDSDFSVLAVVAAAPPCGKPFDDLRVAAVGALPDSDLFHEPFPLHLPTRFPALPARALDLSVATLLARGLLHDEGVGRWGFTQRRFVCVSELGCWFLASVTLAQDTVADAV